LLPGVPVLLHAHNFLKAKAGRSHRARLGQMRRLARVICVSDAVREALTRDYPEITASVTVHNGLDIGVWSPEPVRENTVLMVARAAPAKGVREAVAAMQDVLARHEGWRGLVILSERQAEAAFSAEIEALVAKMPDRIALRWQRPFAEITRSRWCPPSGPSPMAARRSKPMPAARRWFRPAPAACARSARRRHCSCRKSMCRAWRAPSKR
jgi:hypothetical protein